VLLVQCRSYESGRAAQKSCPHGTASVVSQSCWNLIESPLSNGQR
jgi:hypothetical protein